MRRDGCGAQILPATCPPAGHGPGVGLAYALTMTYDRILVALDGSPRAETVLEAALHLADATNGKLVLFRAVGLQPDVPAEAYGVTPNALADILRAKARAALDVIAQRVPPARLAGIDVAIAAPWRGILDAAERHQVGLIAIGSHGYDVLDRVLGTTASKVVNHARRSVLVVR